MVEQQHAKIIIAHIRREVVPDDALDAFARFVIQDMRLEYLDRREGFRAAIDRHIHRDDFKLDRIAIPFGIIPIRYRVEAVVDHPNGVAQVILPAIAPRQIRKVRRDASIIGGEIIFVEAGAVKRKSKVMAHDERTQSVKKPEYISPLAVRNMVQRKE